MPRPWSVTEISDVRSVSRSGHLYRRPAGRVTGGVEQQIAQHLGDALAVGRHQRQIRRQLHVHGVPAAAGEEPAPGIVHQLAHISGFGANGQGAGVDAGNVVQIADQVPHLVGLITDDAQELRALRRIQPAGAVHQRGHRTHDRGQGRAELLAHHRQELGPHTLLLVQRRHVLKCDDQRRHDAVIGANRGGVEQGR